VYSQERAVSYQLPTATPEDEHATYHGGSRNNTGGALYTDNFGNVPAPAAQVTQFPQQTGSTNPGSLGMEWHAVEIAKIAGIVTWKVDNVLLISLDTNNIQVPPGGGNIMFGHSDINAGASTDPLRFDLLFTLIDNIKVATVTAPPAVNPDFNNNNVVDAADYVVWKNNVGLTGTGTRATGDANGDTNVNQADYDLWRAGFGTAIPPGSALAAAVPEPASIASLVLGCIGFALLRRERRHSA
jgi:hypothetical protein